MADILLQINDMVSFFQGSAPDNVSLSKDILHVLGLYSLAIGVVIALLLYVFSFCISQVKIAKWPLKGCFIAAWIMAFVVYDVGMCTDKNWSLLANAPMAVIHAFGTFLFSSDVSEIHESFYKDGFFMMCFSISHAFSALVSTLFVIRIFGFNVIQRIRLYFQRFCGRKNDTYVFWGYNSASFKLIRSINEHYKYSADNKKYRIIVVNPESDSDDSSNTIGFNKIFEILALNDSELQQIQESGCLIATSSHAKLDTLAQAIGDRHTAESEILRKDLHLRSLAKLLTPACTSDCIHFLFLDDDENRNLHDVSILLNDSCLRRFANASVAGEAADGGVKERRVVFYCHARFNGVHRVIEDQHHAKNLEVRVIDSSHLNVEMLKTNKSVLPVNFVNVESDGSVSSRFEAMVIGFSEVGQDAVRFLYEYGAFVKFGCDSDHAVRSEFHLDVFDNKMKDLAGGFMATSPAIASSLDFDELKKNNKALIELHDDDCRSTNFYFKLKDKITTLNYVVIATDDDELNMTMGVRIFRAATRYRKDLNNFCILVRIHSDDDGHFSKIALYYNRLWAAQSYSDEKGEKLNDVIKKTFDAILPLYIFGQDEDVYTYDNIFGNSIIKAAVKFKERYRASKKKENTEPSDAGMRSWYEEVEKYLHTNDDYHSAYACLMRLRRTQRQNISNSQHCVTKELIYDKALKLMGRQGFDWSSLRRCAGLTEYASELGQVDEEIQKLLTVMAQTEHIRWNASHEILGYVYDENGKNEVKMLHDCLADWQYLSRKTRSYDSNVVDLTLGIPDA